MSEYFWLLPLVIFVIGLPYTYYKKGLRFCVGLAYIVSVIVFLRLFRFFYDSESVFLSFVYAAQLFTFGISGKEMMDFVAVIRDDVSGIYLACIWLIYILCPALTVGALLSFIKKGLDRTTIRTRFFKEIYIFSEKNDSSMALARDICVKNKKAVVVFSENDLHEENSKMLFVSSTVYEIYKRINRTNKIYLCFNDTDTGLMLDKVYDFLHKRGDKQKEIYAFTNNPVAYEVVDGMKAEFPDECIKVISTNSILMREILWDYPLFSNIKKGNDLTVSVLGVGDFGGFFAMNTLWCSVMPDCTFKLNLVDFDSTDNILNRVSPNLPDGYFDIEVFNENINTNSFFEKLKTTRLANSDYILVSAGQDDLNISIARKLRLCFARDGKHPFIITVLKNQSRFTALKDALKKDDIEISGGTENIYSYDKIFGDRFFNRAFEVYRLVEKIYNHNATVEDFFKQKQIDIFSSYASAIHTKYKLYGLVGSQDASKNEIEDCLSKNRQKILELEHRRWLIFEVLKGYIGVPKEKLPEFLEKNVSSLKKHKNEKLKIHACITDLDGLDALNKLLKEKFDIEQNFIQIDEAIANHTCDILFTE